LKYFDVFEHPVLGVKAIKHGFSWPGFFFGVFWALFHRLWLPALLLFALATAAGVVLIISRSTLEWALLVLGIGVFAGFHGNDWCRVNVSKHGFTYVGTEQADTPDAAVATAIRKRKA
jgi:hypothetical protein